MASQPEIFNVSGPVDLPKTLDWGNTFHRRSVAASLTQGVYSLERDRQRADIEHQHDAHASPWWKRFHFKLNRTLKDEGDSSYFGAIYKLKCGYRSSRTSPRYVIAFRGTLFTDPTRCEDMKLNFKTAFAKLEESPRFRTAFAAVMETVKKAGAGKVWLAGHSLGASIAMLAGRNMAMSEYLLETYLFNPPFNAVPLERMIKNETLNHGLRITGSLTMAAIGKAMNIHRKEQKDDMFVKLSEWRPKVFVNPKDPVCLEYIGYFKHREKMDDIGVGKHERTALKCLFGKLISGVPTVDMTVNISSSEGLTLRQAHGIVQWWQPHSQWQSKLYKFKTL